MFAVDMLSYPRSTGDGAPGKNYQTSLGKISAANR